MVAENVAKPQQTCGQKCSDTVNKNSVQLVLLEISDNENRALYTGIAGAGNIIPAIFPVLGGWLIEQTGYRLLIVLYVILILVSLIFIYKLDCKK